MSMKDLTGNMRERYEPEYIQSIRSILRPGMLTYDIGAYDGITSVLIAEAVGGENVVLVEPAEMNWATTQAYWNAHKLPSPKATYSGFLTNSDKANLNLREVINLGAFPRESSKYPVSQGEEHLRFRTIHSPDEQPFIKFDTLAGVVGAPAAIAMDVEGAEFLVLLGAEKSLREHNPIVWVSIHPAFMKERFNHDPENLREYMRSLGYRDVLVKIEHEEHWQFLPGELE
jgi:FkbM family methyltransferase